VTDAIREIETSDNGLGEQAIEHTLAANPLVGVRSQDILDSTRMLLGKMLNNPTIAAREYLSLLGELGRIALGESELSPDDKDKRFADPTWKQSAAFRALAQCYLAWGGALNRFVDKAPRIDLGWQAPIRSDVADKVFEAMDQARAAGIDEFLQRRGIASQPIGWRHCVDQQRYDKARPLRVALIHLRHARNHW